jgi:hypothetical protein
MLNKLIFGKGNAKLGKHIATFSLPSGFSCPGALECLSRANRKTGKITDGPQTRFRCFAASQEAAYPNVRFQRWHNFDSIKSLGGDEMVSLISNSLPKERIIRVHVAGDFFSQKYFDAWMEVARRHPDRLFYAYTKSVNFWINYGVDNIPANFKLTASRGGRYDAFIDGHKLKCAEVVFSEEEARAKGLELDFDDSMAYAQDKSFGLLLHGTQPKGSKASKAWQVLKVNGFGYSKN